jgi:hypothetical protein
MSRRSLTALGILTITLATACAPAAAPVQPDTIVALERGALDRWGRGDPQGYLDLYAREVTYFDPMREKRIDGVDRPAGLSRRRRRDPDVQLGQLRSQSER